MKNLIAVAMVSMMAAACANQRGPAELAIKGLDDAVAAATPEVEKFAADQMGGITDAVGAVKKKFEGGDYAGVLTDVTGATSKVSAAVAAAAKKKAELTTEWGTYAALPGMVGQITTKLTELGAMRRLPAGLDKAKLDGAKASLDSVNSLWTAATAAFGSGDLMQAVAKAKEAKPMVDTLMTMLGLAAAAAE